MSVSRLDKFVRERAKTASLAEAHSVRERAIELTIASGASSHMLRSAVALAVRCFTGTVHLVVDDADSDAASVALEEARTYGATARVKVGSGPEPVVRLGLGKAIDGVFVDAAGPVAYVNKLATNVGTAWPPAAAFAVACGFGKLFARMLGVDREIWEEPWDFSLLTLTAAASDQPAVPAELDIGKVVLIGAGAIGSAFAFALKMCGWRCDLRIVDPQAYDEPNHETTLLISKRDALACLPKAKTLAGLVAGGGITADPIEERVGPRHAVLESKSDVLVCAVDNPGTRRILDNAACGLLLNGAVGGSDLDAGLVLWTRHADGDPTLASLYPESAETKSNSPPPTEVAGDECSRVAYEGVALAAPFMALASASLLAAACAHRALGAPPAPRYLQFDLLELQSKYSEMRRTSGA
jgi:molybdopterin/thiamine biosynthesis adenylyltransferase